MPRRRQTNTTTLPPVTPTATTPVTTPPMPTPVAPAPIEVNADETNTVISTNPPTAPAARIEAAVKPYFMSFVGSRIYTPETFSSEAEQHGASRPLPDFMAKRFDFGDKILLATYDGSGNDGRAFVFGYFTVDNVKIYAKERSAELQNEVITNIGNVPSPDRIYITEDSQTAQLVTLMSGSYYIRRIWSLPAQSDSLKNIIEKIRAAAKALGIKTKFFLSGKFHRIEAFSLSPVSFSQMGSYVGLDISLDDETAIEKKIIFINGLTEKKYLLRYERDMYSQGVVPVVAPVQAPAANVR